LAGILVEAQASGLWLSATDLEVSLRVRVPASDLTPGRLVVPGHQTAELIRFLPEGEVAAEQADNSVLLRYARGQNQITTLDAQQFPAFPEPETGARITLDAQQWQALLKQVVIACGHDDVQPMFNGILWDLGPNRPLNLVATDTHRLAWWRVNCEVTVESEVRAVVPRRTVEIAARLAQGVEEGLSLTVGRQQVSIQGEGFLLLSRVIEGRYPNYEAVIPRELTTTVGVEVSVILEALERAAVLVREEDKTHANIVRLEIGSGVLIVSGRSSIGTLMEPVEARVVGEGGEVFFNVRYLLDGLKALPGSRASLGFNRDFSAAVLRPEGDEGYTYLVLPVIVRTG
jgi:DNA polymerase-3 subunit beta